jgi:hypothetical protein
MQLTFDLETLPELDRGKAAAAFRSAIKRVIADIESRPGEKKPRTATLELHFVPDSLDEKNQVDGVEVSFNVKTKVPAQLTTSKLALKKGALTCASLTPEDPAQTDFEDVDPVTDEIRKAKPAVRLAANQ